MSDFISAGANRTLASDEGEIVFREKNVESETEASSSVIVFEFSPLASGHKIYVMVCEISKWEKEGEEEKEDKRVYSRSFVCCNRSQAQRMGVYQMDHFDQAYQVKKIFENSEYNMFPSKVSNQL
jgi:hypothetical protein